MNNDFLHRPFLALSFQVVFSPVVSVWSVPHIHSTTTTAFACIFQCFFCQQVQQSCNSSSASPEEPSEENHDCEMVKMTKSKTFQAYLPNCHRTYSCIHCRAHLANHDELISKVSGDSNGLAGSVGELLTKRSNATKWTTLFSTLIIAQVLSKHCSIFSSHGTLVRRSILT